jgi:Dyp-type peroxidase family
MDEDVLEIDDIQGNSLAGFRKDCQRFLFFAMDPSAAGLAGTRHWLRDMAPRVSSVAEVHAFNQLFRSMRKRRGQDPAGLSATWVNLAVSARALRRLTSDAEVEQFTDPHFKSGLARTAILLNDPVDESGTPIDWKVGGHDNEADILVIIASDDPSQAGARAKRVHALIREAARVHGVVPLTLIWDQVGHSLPAPLGGHEHFGFKDGVSQPGVRGLSAVNPPQFFSERIFDASVLQDDEFQPEFSRPGQPLVWPGQFVFGYNRQSPQHPRTPVPPAEGPRATTPVWGRNGSYVVWRRLRQDVRAFREFMELEANRLRGLPAFAGMDATQLAAKLVGRWPSGAPLMRAPRRDDPALAADAQANNFFVYANDSPPPMPLAPDQHYPGDTFAISAADGDGRRCPLSAHVRKVNPRDGLTEQGSTADVLTRLVLRRGIPFGDAYDTADPETRDLPEHDRGLIFVSYQTSIDSQFVFLQKNWANDSVNPNNGGGQDSIIGQRNEPGRVRTVVITADNGVTDVVTLDREWVIPTGGGFFFSPSISTIANVLGRM